MITSFFHRSFAKRSDWFSQMLFPAFGFRDIKRLFSNIFSPQTGAIAKASVGLRVKMNGVSRTRSTL